MLHLACSCFIFSCVFFFSQKKKHLRVTRPSEMAGTGAIPAHFTMSRNSEAIHRPTICGWHFTHRCHLLAFPPPPFFFQLQPRLHKWPLSWPANRAPPSPGSWPREEAHLCQAWEEMPLSRRPYSNLTFVFTYVCNALLMARKKGCSPLKNPLGFTQLWRPTGTKRHIAGVSFVMQSGTLVHWRNSEHDDLLFVSTSVGVERFIPEFGFRRWL